MDTKKVSQSGSVDQGHPPLAPGDSVDVARAPNRPHWLPSLAINAFSSALAFATAALVLVGPLHGEGPLRLLIPQPEMLTLFCVLWAAAILAPISLHYRGNTNLMVLDAVPMFIGLVFLSPLLLVLGCVGTEAFVRSVVRRQPPVKVAFNVASVGFGATIAAVIFRELLGGHSPVSLRGWGAAAAALCAIAVIMELNVRFVTMLNGRTTERRTGSQLTTEVMLVAVNVCLAIVVLDAVWFDMWATVPLLLVAVLIIAAYRGYTRLSLRFASLQRLYDFSRALGTASLEPSSMSLDVLRQVCTVMRARRAQLVLAEPSGIPRRISLDDRGPSGIEPISLDESSIVTRAIDTGIATLHNSNAQNRRLNDPIAGEYSDAIVAPLMNENTAIGAILALDRDEELDPFDDDDLRLFETLVAHASASWSALASSRSCATRSTVSRTRRRTTCSPGSRTGCCSSAAPHTR